MVVRDVGAYGAVMGSMYLRRPLPPEVLVRRRMAGASSGAARRSTTC